MQAPRLLQESLGPFGPRVSPSVCPECENEVRKERISLRIAVNVTFLFFFDASLSSFIDVIIVVIFLHSDRVKMLAQGFSDLFFDAAPHLEYFSNFELSTKAAFAKAALDTLQNKSGKNPLKSCAFRGTRRTPDSELKR